MNEVLFERSDAVGTVTLNRPEQRNALDLEMCESLLAAARSAGSDPSLRVLLVRAAGTVFCAGADRKEREKLSPEGVRARRLKAFAAYDAIEKVPIPVIAVVEGPAIGSGVEIAAACDFIVATPAASFRTPEALLRTLGATQRLPRILGKRLAKDLMFTGRTLSAEEARTAGLVSRVVEPDDLETELSTLTASILSAPPDALRAAKRCIDRGLELDPRGALATEILEIEEMLSELSSP